MQQDIAVVARYKLLQFSIPQRRCDCLKVEPPMAAQKTPYLRCELEVCSWPEQSTITSTTDLLMESLVLDSRLVVGVYRTKQQA